MEIALLINIIILLISLLILSKASHMTITNAIKTSEITGLGKMTIGFVLIAFSTSLPEFCVAVIAAFTGESAISIGNVIGSNIVNVCLIIGLVTLLIAFVGRSRNVNMISPMVKEEIRSLYFGLFVASIIPLSLLYLAHASRFIGLALLLVFGLYTYQLSKIRILTKDEGIPEEERRKLRSYGALTFAGVAGVIISSYFIVDSAVKIAEFAGAPKALMGATIIAFGTSLPEFSTSVDAFLKGHSALALGNIVGSCFINITLILGVTLVASPLEVNMIVFSDLVTFSLIANLFLWYFLTLGRINWREGAILLFVYLLFLATTVGAIRLR